MRQGYILHVTPGLAARLPTTWPSYFAKCGVSPIARHEFEGRVDGEILEQPTGEGGFGYDAVFRPQGYELSFAQMPLEVKNSLSHRGRAVEKMRVFLSEL